MTIVDRANTPMLLTVPEAATALGIGRTLAYRMIRDGEWPTPGLRVGRLVKIPAELVRRGPSARAQDRRSGV